MRIAKGMLDQQKAATTVDALREADAVAMKDVQGLMASYREAARRDEGEPSCFVIGRRLMSTSDGAPTDRTRDGLGFFADHLLIIEDPSRDAAMGTLLRMLFKRRAWTGPRHHPSDQGPDE